MSVELHLTGGVLTRNGDLEIHQLNGSSRFSRVCESIGFPDLGLPIQLKSGSTAVIKNSHKVHEPDRKRFVIFLENPPSQEVLGELRAIISASDAKLSIKSGKARQQHDRRRTHRMSKARHPNPRR